MRLVPQRIGLTVTALLLAGLLMPSASTAATKRGCFPKDGHGVLRTDRARIFSRPGGPDFYGCLFATGRPLAIGEEEAPDSGSGTFLNGFRVAGPFVAYIESGSGRYEPTVDHLWLYDLRRSHDEDLATFGFLYPPPYPAPLRKVRITDMELKRTGATAWIHQPLLADTFDSPLGPPQVMKHDRGGTASLDTGPGIDPKSLTLSGSTLTWTNGGQPRTATLY